MVKITKPDLGNLDAEREPYISTPNVQDEIGQTLARLIAWDDNENIFRFIPLVNARKIAVASLERKPNRFRLGATSVAAGVTTILSDNEGRIQAGIENRSNDEILITWLINGTNVVVARLAPFQWYVDSVFKGQIGGSPQNLGGDIYSYELM